MKRWRARIAYRHDDGSKTYEREIEEIADLHDLIEKGPHFDTVVSIDVDSIRVERINHVTSPTLTVEEAERPT